MLKKALDPDPNRRHASLDAFAVELQAGRWPDDAVVSLLEDALDLQKRGLLVEAYDALNEAQRLAPGHEDIHHTRARIFFLEREFKPALKENAKALNIRMTQEVCLLHGQCLTRSGPTFREGASRFFEDATAPPAKTARSADA